MIQLIAYGTEIWECFADIRLPSKLHQIQYSARRLKQHLELGCPFVRRYLQKVVDMRSTVRIIVCMYIQLRLVEIRLFNSSHKKLSGKENNVYKILW